MTIDLNAIKARCEALDERMGEDPWTLEGPNHYGLFTVYDSDGNAISHDVRELQAFIVHSRADVPALVAEVERLRGELHDEQVRRDEWEKMYNRAVSNDTYWEQYYEESQPMRIRLMRESRIRKVCLEMATEALEWYSHGSVLLCGKAGEVLAKIERRLAELEPAPDATHCGHPREAMRGDGVTHWCTMCQEEAISCKGCDNQGSVALFRNDPASGNSLCQACEGYKEEANDDRT